MPRLHRVPCSTPRLFLKLLVELGQPFNNNTYRCQETLKKLGGNEPEKTTVIRKRKRPKGPNPLSCKKKKSEEGTKKKKKKKKNSTKEEQGNESCQNSAVTDSLAVPNEAVK